MLRYLYCYQFFMHLSLASYGNRLVMDKARTHQNSILVKKIKHLKFNNISFLKQRKTIFRPILSSLSRINTASIIATPRSIEIRFSQRLDSEANRYSSEQKSIENKRLQRSLANRICSVTKPQQESDRLTLRQKALTRIIRKTKSINLTLFVEKQQNQQFTCRLWRSQIKVNEQLFMFEVLRCKNNYLLYAIWEKESSYRLQVKIDESKGSKFLSEIDYDYQKLCTMLNFEEKVLFLEFQLKNDTKIHHFRFRKRRNAHSILNESYNKCQTQPIG